MQQTASCGRSQNEFFWPGNKGLVLSCMVSREGWDQNVRCVMTCCKNQSDYGFSTGLDSIKFSVCCKFGCSGQYHCSSRPEAACGIDKRSIGLKVSSHSISPFVIPPYKVRNSGTDRARTDMYSAPTRFSEKIWQASIPGMHGPVASSITRAPPERGASFLKPHDVSLRF